MDTRHGRRVPQPRDDPRSIRTREGLGLVHAMTTRDQFYGMSAREMREMPMTLESDVGMIWPSLVDHVEIATAQEAYVREVFERCPGWRWRKKHKLAQALEHAELVTKYVTKYVSKRGAA